MKAKNLTGKHIVRILKEDGWFEVGVRGSHHYFKHPVKLGKISVPVHAGKPLKMKGLQYSVVLLPDHEAGGFTVEVPDLPGCVTEGDTRVAA